MIFRRIAASENGHERRETARREQNIVRSCMLDKHFQQYKRCRLAALFRALALMKARINGGTIHGPLTVKGSIRPPSDRRAVDYSGALATTRSAPLAHGSAPRRDLRCATPDSHAAR